MDSMKHIRTIAVLLLAACALAVTATSAMAREVIYNNENTVAKIKFGTEDTYSQGYECCGVTSAGALVKFGNTERSLKTVTAEVDSFKCEYGVYYFENCRSKVGKKYPFELTVKIYELKGTEERGALLGEQTRLFKIPDRPTTNVSCPKTGEGKGFGTNCDVGGFLTSVEFKAFSGITLPEEAIVEISSPTANGYVNLGQEEAYKEFDVSTQEYIGVPGSGTPEVGSNPLSSDMFQNGLPVGGFHLAQPVFKIEAAR